MTAPIRVLIVDDRGWYELPLDESFRPVGVVLEDDPAGGTSLGNRNLPNQQVFPVLDLVKPAKQVIESRTLHPHLYFTTAVGLKARYLQLGSCSAAVDQCGQIAPLLTGSPAVPEGHNLRHHDVDPLQGLRHCPVLHRQLIPCLAQGR